MRRPSTRAAVLAVAAGLALAAGCADRPTGPPPNTSPLTVAEWKTMPAEKKYEVEAYERLKAGEAKFQDERAWEQFYRTVVLPGKAKERPAPRL